MITTVDQLSTGKPWPPASEADRLEKYSAHRMLYQARHKEVFKEALQRRIFNERTHEASLMPLNYPRRLIRHRTDLIWKNQPSITSEESAEDFEALLERSSLMDCTGPELTIDHELFGDGLLRVYLDEGRAVVESISPENWIAVKGSKLREPSAHVLFNIHDIGTKTTFTGTKRNRVITFEIYTNTRIERRVFKLEDSAGKGTIIGQPLPVGDYFDVEAESVPAQLIIPCHGDRTSADYHGADSLTDIEPIVAEMEVRVAQISKILDTHSDPISSGPDLSQRDPTTGASYTNLTGSHHVVRFDETAPKFEYHTWDGQLSANFEMLDRLMKSFYFLAETTPAAFGTIERGSSLSGVALRLMMFADEAKADRLTISIEKSLKRAFEVAGILEGRTYEPQFRWKPVIVSDEVQEVDRNIMLVDAGLRSKRRAVMDVNDFDTEQAVDDELEAIAEEQATTGVMSGASGLLRDRLTTNLNETEDVV